MRPRLLAVILVVAVAGSARGQDSDPLADGLTPGAYLRVGGGIIRPVNAQGSLKDWKPGNGVSVAWESWEGGQTAVSRLGFALHVAYSTLSLDTDRFLTEFVPPNGGTATSVSGKHAGLLEITTDLRFRIPAPFIMPSLILGLGFIDWRPGEVSYTAASGSGTTHQQHRSGGAISFGGGLDKTLYDRVAIFGEGSYVYGYTQYGTGVCASSGCDARRSTTVATVRGGLRVRMMR